MKILIAEDDPISRVVLERTLTSWGHEVVVVCDGEAAWEILKRADAPKLAILDWMMPLVDGLEVCRRVRTLARTEPTYIILLTAKHQKEDIANGLDSGANDYVTKPFDRRELRARLNVGERMTILQRDLAERVHALEAALEQIHQLQTLLPICSYCKSVRDDQNYWQKLDTYFAKHSDVQFSHGICPDCYRDVVVPEMAALGIDLDKEK
jgi:sigma-B regulation protein RsbU (phosphoserine phosphatase)